MFLSYPAMDKKSIQPKSSLNAIWVFWPGVRRHLSDIGYKYRNVPSTCGLTKKQKRSRLEMVTRCIEENLDWVLCVFIDEKRFNLDGVHLSKADWHKRDWDNNKKVAGLWFGAWFYHVGNCLLINSLLIKSSQIIKT